MLHHFENGMALIKAAIIELHEKRLRAFRRAAETDQHDPATLVRTYWRQLQKPAFIAFHELALAARTHADLARILQIGRATSELQSLMRNSYAVFCLNKKT